MTVNLEVTLEAKVQRSTSFMFVPVTAQVLRFRTLNLDLLELNSSVLNPFPDLANRMRRLGLRLEEFEEIFSRSSGPGGQHVNKVSTSVTLVHRPSGISVAVQETRSQFRNRQLAISRLITRIEEARKEQVAERRSAVERERRRNSRRPRALRREIRKTKEHRAEIKQTRAKISPD